MFSKIKRRFRDVSMTKALCLEAEKHARQDGQKEPGSEHFVLAALALPDGTALRAFERLHIDPNGFRTAIAKQYEDALRNVGIQFAQAPAISDSSAPLPSGTGIYKAQPSAQMLVQQLARNQKTDSTGPLTGAHVIVAVTTAQNGVAVRSLRCMGVDLARLAEAAIAEIDAMRAA